MVTLVFRSGSIRESGAAALDKSNQLLHRRPAHIPGLLSSLPTARVSFALGFGLQVPGNVLDGMVDHHLYLGQRPALEHDHWSGCRACSAQPFVAPALSQQDLRRTRA